MDKAVREVVRRAGRRSVAWWRTPTARERTRADAVSDLVGDLAERSQAAEGLATRTRPARPGREDVLVDQLAVVAYDLRLAGGDAAEAAARALLTAYEIDPRPLPGDLLDEVLAGEVGALRDAVERLPRAGDA